jgi:preprotein translocase subunit SecG
MFIITMLLAIVVGTLMTVVVLMQSHKGQGLSGAFGGASGGVGTMLGVRRAADVLSKATWTLAGIFVVLVFAINLLFLPTSATEESIIQRSAAEQPVSPIQHQQEMEQPAQGAGQGQAPAQGQPRQVPAQQAPAQQAPAPQPAPKK